MTTAQELMAAQCARFPTLDDALPAQYLLPRDAEPLLAHLPDGESVAGLMAHSHCPPGSPKSLWSATDTYELFPLLGDRPGAGMDALLGTWREQLATRDVPPDDSSCLVAWPSRDVHATRALLDHGFTPLSVLAVRDPAPAPSLPKLSGTVNIRRAGIADLDAVVELALAELEYASLVGASTLRPDAARLKRSTAQARLNSTTGAPPSAEGDTEQEKARPTDKPVWLAEQDGVPVALAECGFVSTDSSSGHRLPAGTWGYVNCLSVHSGARGSGIGQQLMAVAHEEFARVGVTGSYLYYNPPNPLSSVFWPRQGYRPLWTMWEIRPATALR